METRWFYIARHAVLKKLLWGVGGVISGPHSGGIINSTHAGIAIPFSRHHHREANYKLQGQTKKRLFYTEEDYERIEKNKESLKEDLEDAGYPSSHLD